MVAPMCSDCCKSLRVFECLEKQRRMVTLNAVLRTVPLIIVNRYVVISSDPQIPEDNQRICGRGHQHNVDFDSANRFR
jgi:hypothetical protein